MWQKRSRKHLCATCKTVQHFISASYNRKLRTCALIFRKKLNFERFTPLWAKNSNLEYNLELRKLVNSIESELKLNYPGIDFISININANYNDVWKQMLRQYKFTTHNEYKFANASDAKRKLALNYINKVILVDEKSTIINSNANMFNIYFEEELASLK
mgnify:CR=1 FL=1